MTFNFTSNGPKCSLTLNIYLLGCLFHCLWNRNLFLKKKSSWPRADIDLARVEKGKGIPDNTAPKSYLLFLSRTTIENLSTNLGTEQKAGKNSQQMGFVTHFLNGTSQEITVKLNEGRLQKFYQVKQLKENSTENSPEKNFKEDSQLHELWNISTKKKKKKKKKKREKKKRKKKEKKITQNTKNFVSREFS